MQRKKKKSKAANDKAFEEAFVPAGENFQAKIDQIAKENEEKAARIGKLLSQEFEKKILQNVEAAPAKKESVKSVESLKKASSPSGPVFRWNVQSKVKTFGDEFRKIDLSVKEIEKKFALLQ